MVVLVALVAMLISVIALSRSMDTHHLVAGNLAFRNSTVHSSDAGVQSAVLWLQSTVGTPRLNTTEVDDGYYAMVAEPDWDDEAFWAQCAGLYGQRMRTTPATACNTSCTACVRRRETRTPLATPARC